MPFVAPPPPPPPPTDLDRAASWSDPLLHAVSAAAPPLPIYPLLHQVSLYFRSLACERVKHTVCLAVPSAGWQAVAPTTSFRSIARHGRQFFVRRRIAGVQYAACSNSCSSLDPLSTVTNSRRLRLLRASVTVAKCIHFSETFQSCTLSQSQSSPRRANLRVAASCSSEFSIADCILGPSKFERKIATADRDVSEQPRQE